MIVEFYKKNKVLIALIFPFVSGVVNIYGIKHWGLVVTNVTGHVSDAMQATGLALRTSLVYILAYALGSAWGFSAFYAAAKFNRNWLYALPALINFLIFILALYLDNLTLSILVFAMSCQNAFGIYFSEGQIRPSQMTGIMVNLGEDMAQYLFTTKNKSREIALKLLNVTGFVAGGIVAFYINSKLILLIPIGFYLLSSVYILVRKQT